MQEVDRTTESVMLNDGKGTGHIRQSLPILDEMLEYVSRMPSNLPGEIIIQREHLLSLLEVVELCAESYLCFIADKELLIEEDALEATRRSAANDAVSNKAAAHATDAVQCEVLKAFINSSAFWNDLLLLQTEKLKTMNGDPLVSTDEAVLSSASNCVMSEQCDYSFLLDVFDEFGDIFEIPEELRSVMNEVPSDAPTNEAVICNRAAAHMIDPIGPIQAQPCDIPGEEGFYEVLVTALVRDLEIINMKVQKEVPYDEGSGSLIEVRKIIEDLETMSRKGPMAMTVTPVFLMCVVCIALVGRLGSSSFASHPILVPLLWCTAFVINVIAVSVPGRLDRMYSDGSHIKPWQSLFEPSPWAFAIWGVIYLTELLVTVYLCVFYKSMSSEFGAQGFPSALPYWTAGNCLQALWCFVFRPEFKSRLWIPSCCLFLSSLSLFGAYRKFYMVHHTSSAASCMTELWSSSAFQSASSVSNFLALVVARSIIAVHSTWIMGAALINFNSWVALSSTQSFSRRTQIAIAFISAWFMATAGMILSMYSSDISFALTCAWALDALASRSMDKSKLMYKSQSDIDRTRCASTPELLETLSIIESILSGIVKCVAMGVVMVPFATGYLTSA